MPAHVCGCRLIFFLNIAQIVADIMLQVTVSKMLVTVQLTKCYHSDSTRSRLSCSRQLSLSVKESLILTLSEA